MSKHLASLLSAALLAAFVAVSPAWTGEDPFKTVYNLKSSDGQPLILPDQPRDIPARPADPKALPEEDAGHWFDNEFPAANVKKLPMPDSPGDGPKGKKVTYLKFIDHPYLTAMSNGMQKIADHYGIELKTMVANNDINIQSQQIDQCINERPDLVIINPVDATACVPLLKKLHDEEIPVIASNLLPVADAHKYILCWTGPDDWGQFRMLAQEFAKKLGNEGGWANIRHYPGTSAFFARTYGPLTELKKVAPKMELLDMQATELNAEKTMQVVSDWLTRFGPKLKGIIAADDSGAMVGIAEAIERSGRKDIVVMAAGNSKVGMDFVKAGKLDAITYQSAEADGAVPLQVAAEWFAGKEIPAIRWLPKHIITAKDVDEFMPAQW